MKLFMLLLLAAVPKGAKLHVKEPGATMFAKPDGKGAQTKLAAGEEVTWHGSDAKSPSMQAVEHKGKKGWVPQGALTPNRPTDERGADGKPVQPAPVKLDVPSSQAGAQQSADALRALEEGSSAAKQKVPEHVKQAGLR